MNIRGLLSGVVAASVVLSAVTVSAVWANQEKGAKPSETQPKNIIFMAGDGMGASQRQAIRLSKAGLQGELEMDRMPYTGSVHTGSADPEDTVTDSAAAATAMATGVKTYNGAIGVDPNKKPVASVLEQANKSGISTGLVTTSQVTDATPAAFASHVEDRDDQSEIARQFIEESKPDVILGGGEDNFYPKGNPGQHPDRPDAKTVEGHPTEESRGKSNLVERAKKEGYTHVHDREGLKKAKGSKLLGLFANEEMFKMAPEGKGAVYNPAVPLPDMTEKALETLSANERGFFLTVEEEAIDEMSHQNNAELAIQSGNQFDKAVAVAKSFAKKNGDTLVIVVGDHESGGMTIEGEDDPEQPDESGDGVSKEDGPFPVAGSDKKFKVDWTTTEHTGVDVPLTAMGPGAEQLTGVYENTRIHDVMLKAIQGE